MRGQRVRLQTPCCRPPVGEWPASATVVACGLTIIASVEWLRRNPCRQNNRLRRFIKHNPCRYWQIHKSPISRRLAVNFTVGSQGSIQHLTKRRFIMAVQCASFTTGIVVITPNALERLTPADIQRGLQRHRRATGAIWARQTGRKMTGPFKLGCVCCPVILVTVACRSGSSPRPTAVPRPCCCRTIIDRDTKAILNRSPFLFCQFWQVHTSAADQCSVLRFPLGSQGSSQNINQTKGKI